MNLTGLLGVAALLAIAFALSANPRRIQLRPIVAGLLLQFTLAALLLKFPPAVAAFDALAAGVTKVISFTDEGTRFIFGNAADASGAWGFIFAVKVLPIIIFFASFMAVLYHLGLMQRVIALLARALRGALGVTGVEAMSASANIFVGQTEAPLTVRPFIARMTRSQLMAVMTGGFATIAGSVMAAYIVMIGGDDPAARAEIAKHFMIASVMSAPAGLLMAKIMLPETESPADESIAELRKMPRTTANVMDAAAEGAGDGLKLALNVAAMLVAFVSLIALLNWPFAALSEVNADWLPIAAWRRRRSACSSCTSTVTPVMVRSVGSVERRRCERTGTSVPWAPRNRCSTSAIPARSPRKPSSDWGPSPASCAPCGAMSASRCWS